jgi:membrane protease YdiL (CAAX protease family)
MIAITTWAKKHPLLAFFVLAYALSWIVEIPLALEAEEITQTKIPFSAHYLAAYGPMLSALMVTGVTGGSQGLRELLGRMTKWKISPGWWLMAVAPLGLYIVVATALWLIQGVPMNLVAMGQVDYLPDLGLAALPMWVLSFGIGEETGWRGFALPRLQEGRSALRATIILWVFWALWHLPLFFYSYEVSILPGFLIGILAGAIVFTWLYNSTGGSVLLVALWHGTFNFTTACVTCKTSVNAAVVSALVMVWAVIVILHFKPARLSHPAEQVIGNIQDLPS